MAESMWIYCNGRMNDNNIDVPIRGAISIVKKTTGFAGGEKSFSYGEKRPPVI